MKIGQTIQCQACGASSVIKHHEKSLLECQYCGAMMAYSDSSIKASTAQSQRKPAKIGLMLIILPIVVIVLMVIFWLVFENIRKQVEIETYDTEAAMVAEQENNGKPEKINNTSLVPVKPLINNKSQSSADENSDPINQNLKIESQVSGITTNGGKYWIFAVKNTGEALLARPGVMVSLFNQTGQRVAEQGGWSLKEVLAPEEQTTVLVFLSEPPADATEQQINTLASKPSPYGLKQINLKVQGFKVTAKNKQYEIIGDVINDQQSPVKFTRVVAVAYDSDRQPIGIGNAFSTVKDLAPNQSSGFKVKVGTFLTTEPDSWQLWAVARAQ